MISRNISLRYNPRAEQEREIPAYSIRPNVWLSSKVLIRVKMVFRNVCGHKCCFLSFATRCHLEHILPGKLCRALTKCDCYISTGKCFHLHNIQTTNNVMSPFLSKYFSVKMVYDA